MPTTHIRRKCLWHFSTHATFWKVEQKVDGKHLEQLEREKKMHEKAFQNYFFCTISPFLKVCFHSLRKRIYFLSKILKITKVCKTFSAFGGDRINMEKLIFVSHFCFWRIIKSFPSIVNFFLLFSILRIDSFYIFEAMMYLCVCKYVQYTTRIALFSIDCFFSGHSSAQKNEYQSGVFSSNQLSVCYHAIISFTILQYYSIRKDGKKRGIHFLDFLYINIQPCTIR